MRKELQQKAQAEPTSSPGQLELPQESGHNARAKGKANASLSQEHPSCYGLAPSQDVLSLLEPPPSPPHIPSTHASPHTQVAQHPTAPHPDATQWKPMLVLVDQTGTPLEPLQWKPLPTTDAVSDPVPIPPPSSDLPLHHLPCNVHSPLGSQPSAPKGHIEVDGPEPLIKECALNWKLADKKPGSRKLKWPFPKDMNVALDTYKQYLSVTRHLKESSVKQHLRNIRYVYGMWDLPGQFSQPVFVASLYLSGASKDWLALPIMDPRIPAVRNIHAAVDSHVDNLITEALRERRFELHRCLCLFKTDALVPLGKGCVKAREVADALNRESAAEVMEHMAPEEVLSQATVVAMVEI